MEHIRVQGWGRTPNCLDTVECTGRNRLMRPPGFEQPFLRKSLGKTTQAVAAFPLRSNAACDRRDSNPGQKLIPILFANLFLKGFWEAFMLPLHYSRTIYLWSISATVLPFRRRRNTYAQRPAATGHAEDEIRTRAPFREPAFNAGCTIN